MLCGEVRVAAWVLAVLLFGLSAPAEPEPDPEFPRCRESFYRQTPPQGLTGTGLLRLCHGLPGGRAFASLYHPACGVSVYTAFSLSKGNGRGEGREDESPIEEEREDEEESHEEGPPEDPQLVIPALLRPDGDYVQSSAESSIHEWDALISELVQNSATPLCSTAGGDLYMLTGAAELKEGESGCEAGVLWSAVCCATPDGGFSVGIVREVGEGERVLSVSELEEVVGLVDIFTGGCGEPGDIWDMVIVSIFGQSLEGLDITKKLSTETGLHITDAQMDETAPQKPEVVVTAAQPDGGDTKSDVTQEVIPDEVMSQSSSEAQNQAIPLHADEEHGKTFSIDNDNETQSSESNVGSTLVYLLSFSISLLSAPLRPIFSTLTQIPGQVTYVLQEDLVVLSALPCDTLSVFQNIVSDMASGGWSTVSMVGRVGEMCASGLYSCTSPLVGTLLSSCQDGVTGLGTLAWDGVGIFGGIVDNAWFVSRFVGGKAWEHSEGYVGAVLSEVGHQAKTVGGGLGKLVWNGGKGVGHVFKMAGGLVGGVVESTVDTVKTLF